MSKFGKTLKCTYSEGIEWMRAQEGLGSMMYWATTIMILLIFCKLTPKDVGQYVLIGVGNFVVVYLYSFVASGYHKVWILPVVQFLFFGGLEIFVATIFGNGLNFEFLLILFVVPIIVAAIMIFLQEHFMDLEDFFALKSINSFGIVVISTLIPMTVIAIPLLFLEVNIVAKIGIVLGFVLIAPLVCWADSKDYGIFGALGLEW